MENMLITIWLLFILVIMTKMYSLWRIIKTINDKNIRKKITDNIKEYIFFKSFPKSIDLSVEGVFFRKMYNSNNVISLVIFISIIVLTIFSSNIVIKTYP